MSRPYDLIIYGAYGYTGTLTAQYLSSAQCIHSTSIKWAVAGRSQGKLDALVAKCGQKDGRIQTIVASVDDEASLDAMCKQTKVLLSFAGPYIKCGLPVVQACVRNGTHYMDVTGEMPFIRRLVDSIHDTAKANKIAIINSCGFDCVPSDMGSLMLHQFVAAETNEKETISKMEGFFELIGGISPSGGTAATLSSTAVTSAPEDLNPLSINPPHHRSGIVAPERRGIAFTKSLGRYSGPFLMACENERIVRRSNCLLGRPNVVYSEAITGSFWTVLAEFLQFWAIRVLLPFTIFNKIVMFFMPKPGDGPTAQEKKGSKYEATFVARTTSGSTYMGIWRDDRNAYDTTAVFVVEAIACLLKTEKNLLNYGVVTPASAFGQAYLDALRDNCGVSTDVSRSDRQKKAE